MVQKYQMMYFTLSCILCYRGEGSIVTHGVFTATFGLDLNESDFAAGLTPNLQNQR